MDEGFLMIIPRNGSFSHSAVSLYLKLELLGRPLGQVAVGISVGALRCVHLAGVTVHLEASPGRELGPRVLLPLSGPLQGERVTEVRLEAGPLARRVICRAELTGRGGVLRAKLELPSLPVRRGPTMPKGLEAFQDLLDDPLPGHDEGAFQAFVEDFASGAKDDRKSDVDRMFRDVFADDGD